MAMDESIGKLCKTVATFCNHLESSCSALKQSVDRRPIPLDSASTTFVQSINRRLNAAGGDLDVLELMSLGTVSFEELLGHCNEVLKKNQNDLVALEDHLRSSTAYIPSLDFDGDDFIEESNFGRFSPGNSSFEIRDTGDLEEDGLLDDSLSLKKFGISDVSLASIASQAESKYGMEEPDFEPHVKNLGVVEGETGDELNQLDCCRHLIVVSIDDYESLPKHMKSLVSLEDLSVAVEKMNLFTMKKRERHDTFAQDEIESLGLGPKARTYLLLLIKMNKLCVETSGGIISYRVL